MRGWSISRNRVCLSTVDLKSTYQKTGEWSSISTSWHEDNMNNFHLLVFFNVRKYRQRALLPHNGRSEPVPCSAKTTLTGDWTSISKSISVTCCPYVRNKILVFSYSVLTIGRMSNIKNEGLNYIYERFQDLCGNIPVNNWYIQSKDSTTCIYCIIRFTSLHSGRTFHLLEFLAEAFWCHVHLL